MKKISKIIVKVEPDEFYDYSDTLGEFSMTKGEYGIRHAPDNSDRLPFFNAANVDNMKHARENYKRAMEFENSERCAYVVQAKVEILTSSDGKEWTITNTSDSVGGVDIDDPDDSYIEELATDCIYNVKATLLELGFTQEEIDAAPCAHRISWRYYDGDVEAGLHPADNGELPESEEEHIRKLLNENYNQGELNYFWSDPETDEEHQLSGWWSI